MSRLNSCSCGENCPCRDAGKECKDCDQTACCQCQAKESKHECACGGNCGCRT